MADPVLSSSPRGVRGRGLEGEALGGVRFLVDFSVAFFFPSPLTPHHTHLGPVVSFFVSSHASVSGILFLYFSASLLISVFLSFPVFLPMSLSQCVLLLSLRLSASHLCLSPLTLGSPV